MKFILESFFAGVTQLGECTAEDRDVVGSSPTPGIFDIFVPAYVTT